MILSFFIKKLKSNLENNLLKCFFLNFLFNRDLFYTINVYIYIYTFFEIKNVIFNMLYIIIAELWMGEKLIARNEPIFESSHSKVSCIGLTFFNYFNSNTFVFEAGTWTYGAGWPLVAIPSATASRLERSWPLSVPKRSMNVCELFF